MKTALTIILILAAVLLVFLAVLFLLFRFVFGVSRKKAEDQITPPWEKQYDPVREQLIGLSRRASEIPAESVYTESFDGYRLHARYYEYAPGAPFYLMFHGYRSGYLRDFSCGIPEALRRGYNVIAVDQRAHRKSEGRCLTFGVLERFDVRTWAQFIGERFGKDRKIMLMGVSMGAATVLMAADLDLPETVTGIIADCGYSSPNAIIRKVCRDMKLPDKLVYPLVRLSAKLFGGFDPDDASAVEALKQSRFPVLLIHGEDDRFVPCEMSRENYAACTSEKTLFTVPGAAHGIAYLGDTGGYRKAVSEFLGRTNPVGT